MSRKTRKFSSVEEAKQWMISTIKGKIIKVIEDRTLMIGPMGLLQALRPLTGIIPFASIPLPERIREEIETWTRSQKGFYIITEDGKEDTHFVIVPTDINEVAYEIWVCNIATGAVHPIEADD